MEVLSEEESCLVMESMTPQFTKRQLGDYVPPRPGSPGQDVLLIHGPGQEYQLTQQQEIPSLNSEREILIKVHGPKITAKQSTDLARSLPWG